jgi:hypothetical protein
MYKKQGNTWKTFASQNISSSLCNAFTHSSAFCYDFRDPVSLRSTSAVIFRQSNPEKNQRYPKIPSMSHPKDNGKMPISSSQFMRSLRPYREKKKSEVH